MPVLYFDTTKSRRQGHFSGLNRVSSSLLKALGALDSVDCRPVRWSPWRRAYVETGTGRAIGTASHKDGFFTPEVFALRERPFCRSWLRRFAGRSGVLFYDTIPHQCPETTWPRSVRRFPHWFRDLQAYDTVFFISDAARRDAAAVSRETGWAPVDGPVLTLGADYRATPPGRAAVDPAYPVLLNVGILEPRKGQAALLEACEALWEQGRRFKLVLLGRVNPHFGKTIEQRIRILYSRGRDIVHESAAGDDRLAHWHQRAHLLVQPSRAEGFGLPVLEALWAGCPVLCSPQPCLETLDTSGGIQVLEGTDAGAVHRALDGLLTHPEGIRRMTREIPTGQLPQWRNRATAIVRTLFGNSL